MQNICAGFRRLHLNLSNQFVTPIQTASEGACRAPRYPPRVVISRDVFKRFEHRIPASPIRIDRKGEIFRER